MATSAKTQSASEREIVVTRLIEATEAERATFRHGMAGMNEGWGGTFERMAAHLEENR